MSNLSDRQKDILFGILQEYVDTALPAGSSHLVQKYHLSCSPATVRNEMSKLEKLGYICQPHTSAGRIPTEKGYRFFVNQMTQWEHPTREEQKQIHLHIEDAQGDLKRIFNEASRILGQISMELGVVLTPSISGGVFDRMELIKLSHGKILAVIHVRSRLVKTVVLKIESEISDSDVGKTASIINERLSGLTLEEIKHSIEDRIRNATYGHPKIMKRISDSASDIFNFVEPIDIHTCGTEHILTQPEFSNVKQLKRMLTLLDDREGMIHLFHKNISRTTVTIGDENEDSRCHSFAVIASSYKRGKDFGTLGVIGPMRMRYQKIVPLVDLMARTMSEHLS